MAFLISRLYLSTNQEKPFNPILGETFQARNKDTQIYLEQTSHHPPISNFLYIGKNYRMYGHNESHYSASLNSANSKPIGNYIIELPRTKSKFKIWMNHLHISGMIMGKRELKFTGSICCVDLNNDLVGEVILDTDKRNFVSKFFKKSSIYPDYFKGIITKKSTNTKISKTDSRYYVIDYEKDVISTIEGHYTQYVTVDGKVYWEYKPEAYFTEIYRQDFTLRSDSTFRYDRNLFRDGFIDEAQKAKETMEELQRRDKKLRTEFSKTLKKK